MEKKRGGGSLRQAEGFNFRGGEIEVEKLLLGRGELNR